jgi:glycosyltransferase involved in cell wall biosynthesis
LILAADIYVQPSRAEGASNALLEALALGTPVVATDVGSASEYVEKMKFGLLAEPSNAADLARCISSVLGDRSLWRQWAEQSREVIVERHSVNKIMNQYREAYSEFDDAGSS